MITYIDLSEKHGHRDDHGFKCGAEFNVKIRRRIDIPNFVRAQLSQAQIDEVWWEEAARSRDALKSALRRYKWIGELAFVGRGPGWLAIEDTGCKPRNWDAIAKVVDQYLKTFIKSMEDPKFWREIAGVTAAASGVHHSTRKKSAGKPTLTKWDLHVYDPKTQATKTIVREYLAASDMAYAPTVVVWASRDLKVPQRYILAVPHHG